MRPLRLVPLLAFVALGSAHPPQLAFKQLAGLSYAILLTDQTGTTTVNLTAGKPQPAVLSAYTWAPDGSRLVYIGNEKTLGGDLEVLDVDSGTVTQITSSSANEHASWSPDGGRIAYIHTIQTKPTIPVINDQDVWLVAPDGSGARQVTHDGGDKYGVAWTRDGSSLIVYGSATQIVDPATGRVLRSSRDGLTFSPDGTHVALTTNSGIDVANADGSGRHRVAGGGAGGPVWSPDGAQIAFTRSHCTPGLKGLCGTILHSIYVVQADGGGERRLTGPLAGGPGSTDDGFPFDFSYGPLWFPDGKQILFFHSQDSGAMVMNADGTCEHRFGPQNQFLGAPSWRPGADPTVPPQRCVDLHVHAVERKAELAVHEPERLDVIVENDGNETATGVTLTLRFKEGSGTIRAPRELGSLAPGGSRRLVATVVPAPGSLGLQLHAAVSADEPSSGPNGWTAYFAVLAGCTIVGTYHADRLTGTAGPDRICALPGNDVIRAGAGNDTIDAGAGYDTIYPGPGRDVVYGGEGRDTIYANDGQRDTIDCGPYLDTLYIDKLDVFRNCERVFLRAARR